MPVGAVTCYRRDCTADAGHKIQLLCGVSREVCWEHLHDWVLEVGSSRPVADHVNGYRHFRMAHFLPELTNDDLLDLVMMAREQSGYKFSDWEY